MTMPRHAFADDLASGDVERREQGRRSVSLVVVGHRAGAALLQRQSWLRAIERLDLALLVDPEHQRLVRRVEIKPDDVLDHLAELGVGESLKPRIRCGFSPCAAQMRCTLESLRPTALASLRADQCVPAGGFSCNVMLTTRSIAAAVRGGFVRDAWRRVRAPPRRARDSDRASDRRFTWSCRSPERSPSPRPLAPTSERSAPAKPASAACCGPPPTLPAAPDPRGDNWMFASLSIPHNSHDPEPIGNPFVS